MEQLYLYSAECIYIFVYMSKGEHACCKHIFRLMVFRGGSISLSVANINIQVIIAIEGYKSKVIYLEIYAALEIN